MSDFSMQDDADFFEEAGHLIRASQGAIDLHSDTPKWMALGYDVVKRHREVAGCMSQWDIPRAQEGGLGTQFFGLWAFPYPERGSTRSIMKQIDAVERAVAANLSHLQLCRSHGDWRNARAFERIAIFLGVEGAHSLEGDLDNVLLFARRGVRYLGLGHFTANQCCCSAGPFGGDPSVGLKPFGYEVLDACAASGVVPDLAHMNRRGFFDVADHAAVHHHGPLIISHTGLSGVTPHWRNIDDDQIRDIADSGGVIGIINSRHFLGGKTLEAMMRHFDHLRNVGGDDVLALGSDHDGFARAVVGYSHVGELPNLVRAFLARKYSSELITKILSGNVLRVLAAAPPRAPRLIAL